MLKRIIFLAVIAAIRLYAGEKLIVNDGFRPGLERTFWINIDKPAEAWKIEKPMRFSQERLRFRFVSGSEMLKSLELIDAASGKVVWRPAGFDKAAMTPPIPSAEYIIRCSGTAGTGKFNMAVNSYRDSLLMPSWTVGDASARFPDSGGVLVVPDSGKNQGTLGTRIFGLEPGKFYRAEVVLNSDAPQELFMRYVQRSGGRKHGDSTFRTGGGREEHWSIDFPSIAASADFSFRIPQKCLFKSLTVTEIAPPERTKNVNGKVMSFTPRNAEPDPANPALNAPVPYRRNPRMAYEDSTPQNFEIIDRLDAFATPGDYGVWYFGVHNPGKERKLELLKVSELRSGDQVIPADDIAVSFVRFWDYPRNPYNYYNIPELILPQETCTLPVGGNRLLWLQTRLKDDCPAGEYTGSVRVRCGEKEIVLPLRLKVLPFKLLTPPNMVWGAYSRLHVLPQSRYPMELMVRYLKDMKDYGVTALHCTIGNEAGVKRFQEARRRAGMNGPMLVYGMNAEKIALQRCGADPKDKRWFDNPKVREAFTAYVREFDSWIKKYGAPGYNEWYYMGADEPHIRSMELAVWQTRLAREAGVPTASCVYAPRYVAQFGEYLNLSCNSFIGNNAATWRELCKVAEGKNLQYWFLGGGCYTGQEGGLMPNRLLSGLMSFKLGVTGHLSYTYQAYRKGKDGDPYDNFTDGKSYGMTYPVSDPTPAKVTVFSLEWEGLREGITDYKYLYTLKQAIADARKKGKNAEADAAQAVLDRILGLVPWNDDFKPGNGIAGETNLDNAKADRLRAMAANAILKLMEVL